MGERNGRSREGGWNAYGNQARLEHCRGGHLCVASTRSGQGPFKSVGYGLHRRRPCSCRCRRRSSRRRTHQRTSRKMSPTTRRRRKPGIPPARAAVLPACASCFCSSCFFLRMGFYINSFFNKRLSQLSNRKVRHRARVLTGAAVLCPRPLDGGVSHCVPAFIACLLISFTRPRPQYRARPLPVALDLSGSRIATISTTHHSLPPVSVWRACADLIRPWPRIPSTAISAPHNAPRNAIPLRARHTVTSPRYPSGLEAAADHQRDWRSYWDVAVHVLQT